MGDAPIGSNMHSKRIKRTWGSLKAQMGMGRSVGPNQSLKEGQNPSVRGLCEGRENRRGLVPIGEAPDSVRDLTRVQHPSIVNGKGCGG